MTSSDDILAMLDRAGEKQVRCPFCERSDDLYIVYPVWMTKMVAAPIAGGLVTGDTHDSAIDEFDPRDAAPPVQMPVFIGCGNFAAHDDDTGNGMPWRFFAIGDDVAIDYSPSLQATIKGFG